MTNINRAPLPEEQPSLALLFTALLFALFIALILTITVVLPAEKGIDPTGIGSKLHLTRMGVIKSELRKPDAPLDNRPNESAEITVSLGPGEGLEIKLKMEKGYKAEYRWDVLGGAVYHDTHGDPFDHPSVYVSYKTEDSVSTDQGTLEAIYGGLHGWYWKNHNKSEVTINLKIRGEYSDIIGD